MSDVSDVSDECDSPRSESNPKPYPLGKGLSDRLFAFMIADCSGQ